MTSCVSITWTSLTPWPHMYTSFILAIMISTLIQQSFAWSWWCHIEFSSHDAVLCTQLYVCIYLLKLPVNSVSSYLFRLTVLFTTILAGQVHHDKPLLYVLCPPGGIAKRCLSSRSETVSNRRRLLISSHWNNLNVLSKIFNVFVYMACILFYEWSTTVLTLGENVHKTFCTKCIWLTYNYQLHNTVPVIEYQGCIGIGTSHWCMYGNLVRVYLKLMMNWWAQAY